MVTVTLASADTLKRRGREGWTSLDYPWMVTVTLASVDTLTWGEGGGGLSMDGHGYLASGIMVTLVTNYSSENNLPTF